MKKILFLLFALFTFGATQTIEAKGVIIYHNGPQVSQVAELPEEANIDETHVNLGVMYDQFGLFWLPVWNYGNPQYVLINDSKDTYWDIDDEFVQQLKDEYTLEIPQKAEIPLFQKIGLKPIIILVILYFVWGAIKPKRKEEDTETAEA